MVREVSGWTSIGSRVFCLEFELVLVRVPMVRGGSGWSSNGAKGSAWSLIWFWFEFQWFEGVQVGV